MLLEKMMCRECKQPMARRENWAARPPAERRIEFACECGHKFAIVQRTPEQQQQQQQQEPSKTRA